MKENEMNDLNYPVTVTVCNVEQYDIGFPPDDAIGFASWLAAKFAEIPPEYMPSAKVEIDTVSSYEDSHYATVEIVYRRPPTDAEVQERIAEIGASEAAQKAKELRLLETLTRKYGVEPPPSA